MATTIKKRPVADSLLDYLDSPEFMADFLRPSPQGDFDDAARKGDVKEMARILEAADEGGPAIEIADAATAAAHAVDLKILRTVAPRMTSGQAAKALCHVFQARCDQRSGRAVKEREDERKAANLLIPLADLEGLASMGMTPLMWAVRADLPDMVEKIASLCDVEAKSDSRMGESLVRGATALNFAACLGHDDCLAVLIPLCDHAATNAQGRPVLMSYSGRSEAIFDQLLARGDMFAVDKDGQSAMEKFIDQGSLGLAERLFDAAPLKRQPWLLKKFDAYLRGPARDQYEPEEFEEFKQLKRRMFATMEARSLAQASHASKPRSGKAPRI